MTEYIYAVVNINGVVDNVVVADAPDSHDALRILIPSAFDIVLVTEQTQPAYIGGYFAEGRFGGPRPYPSWGWNETSWSWVAPVPYPDDGNTHTWDEEGQQWVQVIIEEAEADPLP